MDDPKTVPVCGYQHDDDGEVVSKVFDLPSEDTTLPDGWHDSPAHISDEPEGDPEFTAAQLIDAADGMHHSTLRAHAVKILGEDNTPSKKVEILDELLKAV